MRLPQAVVIPPAVVIHGLDHARAALAPRRPVTLLSGVGAGAYAGCGWWRALVAMARAEAPDVSADGEPNGIWAPDVLDCLDQTGRAIEALRHGVRYLVLVPGAPARADAAARAGALGAVLLESRPPALDLADREASRQLAAWLGPLP